MKKGLSRFTAHEKKELNESVKRANTTIARLVKSFLTVIEETEETPARRERLKTNFLFHAAGVFDAPSISNELVWELEMIATNLYEEKNPTAPNIEALALAIKARLKN